MAERSLVVRVVGDERDLLRSFKKSTAASKKFERDVGRSTRGAAAGLGGIGGLLAKSSAAFLGFYAAGNALRSAFAEMTEAQQVAAQTAAVLKSTGGVANVSARHVDELAASLQNLSGVDDEVIKSGENVLLTFTNVRNAIGKGNDVFDQAALAALNLSTRMGTDLQSAVVQVGKALQDPIRGITALRRVGVNFTKAQQNQIKALVESGRTLEAQKLILQELNVEFGGAARASGDTLAGKLNVLKGNVLNLSASLLEKFSPALEDATENATNLLAVTTKLLEDPRGSVPSLKEFVKGFAQNVPSGAEVIPTIGPFLGAMENAFGKSGEKSAKLFFGGLAQGLRQAPLPPVAVAGADKIVAFFKKQLAKAFGTGTPFLDLQQAGAESTKRLTDDLAVSLKRIVVLRERLAKATGLKEKTDLQNALNSERERADAIRDQIREKRVLAKEVRDEAFREAARKREAARQSALTAASTRQFRQLGVGPGGSELVPTAKSLRKTLGRISDAVKGTFLDTGANKSLFAAIRKVLSGQLGKVSAEVRAFIDGLLDDIDAQLKDHATKGPRTKFRIVRPGDILAGLGLTPEQERAARGRLSTVGSGGTVATGPSRTAFGRPVPPSRGGRGTDSARPIVVNLVVSGRTLASVLLPELQKEGKRRAGQGRGATPGAVLGAG